MPYAHQDKIERLQREQAETVEELKGLFTHVQREIPDDPVSMITALRELLSLYSRVSYLRALTKRQLDYVRALSADFHSDENAKLMDELVTGDVSDVAFAYNLASGLSYVMKAQIDSVRTILGYMREERNEVR